jgi:hypothetical protein
MIQFIQEMLYMDWAKYFPVMLRPTNLRALVSCGSYGRHCKTTFLLFADANPAPFAIVKVPLFEDGDYFVRTEYEVLTKLLAANFHKNKVFVPCCWLIETPQGRPALLESALKGTPFRKAIKRSRNHEGLLVAVNWITQLHQRTRVEHTFTAENYQEFITNPIKHAIDHHVSCDMEADSLYRIARRLEKLIGKSVPLVCSHNDFRVSNVRIHGTTLLVHDWEFAAWPGLPMLDLLNFAVDYHLEISLARFARAFSYVLDERNQYAKKVGSHLREYCAQMGMDENLIPLWVDLFLIHKLHLAQRILFSLQVFDGLEWAEGLGEAIRSRRASEVLC